MTTENQTGPTLTNVKFASRKAIKYVVIGLAAFLVARFLITTGIAIWRALNPPPPPPPTVGFGKLPALTLPESENKPQQYTLETATGKLPTFSDRAAVLFMPQKTPSLLADQEAREIAGEFGFRREPSALNQREYRWNRNEPLLSTLTLDIVDHTFTLYTDFLSRPELLLNTELPDDFAAVQLVKRHLSSAELLPPDVASASGKISYLKGLGGSLAPAVSYSDADFVQVDLFRSPIDGQYELITQDGTKGTISALLSGAFKGTDNIVQLEFHHHEADYLQPETYPLRSVREAWQVIQANEGYIINPQEVTTAVIRDVELMYYDDIDGQLYLQPVYVFKGDNDFQAITSALDQTYVERNP